MSSPAPSPLDDEIESLKAKITTLKSNLRIQTSTLLSSPSTISLISNPSVSSTQLRQKGLTPTVLKSLRHYASLQKAHNQQSLYRTCATITTFRVQDPDPNAVDGGAVLGLRVEVFVRGKFVRPYYVLMNRPYAERSDGRKDTGSGKGKENGKENGKEKRRKGKYANWLRVHRHTVPPCIPLSGLAARYLPAPPSLTSRDPDSERGQDLVKFARRLRRELVRYHHRLATISDLRRAIIAESKLRYQEEEGEGGNKVQDVIPSDAEAKQITIEWEDGQTGKLVMDDDGEIVNVVALNGGQQSGRDREVVRELVGQAKRVEDVLRRLGLSGPKAA